ncbi:MAG: glycosyltransferase family 4 protein [Gemmatimonadetes bacterium]|nr:glycosyltransferase family 4 protein [Gemmatimonadota bacterium]
MNVLHLSSERTWRGGEQQIAYLIHESAKLGARSHVACRRGSAFEGHCQREQIPHTSLAFANETDLGTAWAIRELCRRRSFDLLHLHTGHSHAIGVWSHILGSRVPMILHRRVDFPVRSNPLSRLKFNFRGIRRIICVSNRTREVLQPSLRNPGVCRTVYDGIDPARFENAANHGILHREYGLSPQEKIVANISAIAPHKDHPTFLETADRVVRAGVAARFFIIGGGAGREELRRQVDERRLGSHVFLTGHRNDIAEIFREIDVFLMTSSQEGLGTTILDAFCNRVPVVATAGGGIPEIVRHEETGLLAPVGDADTLAAHVRALLGDADHARRLTEAAHRLLMSGFTHTHMAHGVMSVYREALG